MTTGQRIQQARKMAGLSQRELGEKMGLSASMIGQWENDLRNPKIETVTRIAKVLDVDPGLLLGNNEQMYHTSGYISGVRDVTDGLMLDFKRRGYTFSEQEQALVAGFNMLTEEGQAKAAERVKELTEIPRYQKGPSQPTQAPSTQDSETTPSETPPGGGAG